ncbi:hypothetical protein ACM66B_003868 [Microbotryomycetes sp. NB124-2]
MPRSSLSARTVVTSSSSSSSSRASAASSSRPLSERQTRDGASLYASGVSAYRTGSYDTACELLSEAIALDATQAKYYDARCLVFGKLGRTKDAFMDARLVVKLEPQSYKGYHKAGNLFAKIGNWERAERMLEQALAKLKPQETAKAKDIDAQLLDVRAKKAKASFCPLANLPTEIFAEIINFALDGVTDYNADARPLTNRNQLSTLAAVQSVCKSWRHAVVTNKRFWSRLCLDGEINGKNALAKAKLWEARSRSHSSDQQTPSSITSLALTATTLFLPAQLEAIMAFLEQNGVLAGLTDATFSSVDSPQRLELEAKNAKEWVSHLSNSSHNLRRLTICSSNRLSTAFRPHSVFLAFRQLRSFRLFGKTASGVTGPTMIRCATIEAHDHPGETIAGESLQTQAEELVLCGAISAREQECRLEDFPRLRNLNVEMLGMLSIWQLLSAPDLERFHVIVYGEQRVTELEIPDLERSWRVVKSLRLGGANRFAPRLLTRSVQLNLSFHHLTTLDLAWSILSPEALQQFNSDNAPVLQDVNLQGTTVTVVSISGIVAQTLSLPRMKACRKLNISSTLWTKDSDVDTLMEHSPYLEQLDASYAIELTGRSLMQLVKKRQTVTPDGEVSSRSAITLLKVTGCNKIEDAAVDWLKRHITPGGFINRYQRV